jgi:hypothetical protein
VRRLLRDSATADAATADALIADLRATLGDDSDPADAPRYGTTWQHYVRHLAARFSFAPARAIS